MPPPPPTYVTVQGNKDARGRDLMRKGFLAELLEEHLHVGLPGVPCLRDVQLAPRGVSS